MAFDPAPLPSGYVADALRRSFLSRLASHTHARRPSTVRLRSALRRRCAAAGVLCCALAACCFVVRAASLSAVSRSSNLFLCLYRLLCCSGDFEKTIQSLGRDNVQLLFNKIFDLPTEPIPHDVGKLALLPVGSTPVPREKPVPKPAAPTKWEAFAKLKGIQKQKRSRMVQDDETGALAPRYGYKSARSTKSEAEWAVEAPDSATTGVEDPWAIQAAEKRERVAKNKKQQQRNVLAAAAKGNGGAGANRAPGAIDLRSAVELSATQLGLKGKGGKKAAAAAASSKKKEKHHVDLALSVAQKSTASMGRFDKLRAHEPAIAAPKAASNRLQRADASERARDRTVERGAALAALSKVLTGQKDNDNYGAGASSTGRISADRMRSMGQQAKEATNIAGKKRKAAAAASGKKGGGKGGSHKKDGGSNKKARR
jgi:regulator of ribosome biosynthesis